MNSPRNVELSPWYGQWLSLGVWTVSSYRKPHTFSTCFGEEKKEKMHLLSPTRLSIVLHQSSRAMFASPDKVQTECEPGALSTELIRCVVRTCPFLRLFGKKRRSSDSFFDQLMIKKLEQQKSLTI